MNIENNVQLADMLNRAMIDAFGTRGAEEQKVNFTGTDQGLTFTFLNDKGEVVTQYISVPDLDLPESGTLDMGQIASIIDKLAEEGVELEGKDLDRFTELLTDLSSKCKAMAAATKGADKFNIFTDIYAIIALLASCAKTQREAARASWKSAIEQQLQAIENQAKQQEAAALTGIICTAVSAGAQIIAQGVMATIETTANSKMADLNKQYGADVEQRMANNSMLEGSPAQAAKAMDKVKTTHKMSDVDAAAIEYKISGEMPKEPPKPAPPKAKAPAQQIEVELEDVAAMDVHEEGAPHEEVPPGPTWEEQVSEKAGIPPDKADATFKGVSDARKGLEAAKGDGVEAARQTYRNAIDERVGEYEAKVDEARKEFMTVRDDPKATKVEKQNARAKLDQATKELEYANAVRTKLFSETVGENPASTPQLAKTRENVFRAAAKAARQEASLDPEMTVQSNRAEFWKFTGEMTQIGGRALDGAIQSGIKFFDAAATRQGAEGKRAEFARELAKEVFDDARDLRSKVVQMFQRIQQVDIESQREIFHV